MPLNLTIIGAGPGGYVAAIRAAQMGAKVTLVENSEVGGTCLNRGCIPTKTIIASTRILEQVRRAGDFGIVLNGTVEYSLEAIRERKNKVVLTQIKGIRGLLKSWGVQLIDGAGSLVTPDSVMVVQSDGTRLDIPSDKIIIATGSRPMRLPVFPFDGSDVITSDEAIRLDNVPRSLLIIGAGVIGCEFAFIYRSLGCEVIVVELMPHALSTEDHELSEIIEREMKKAKIKLIVNVKVEKAEKAGNAVTTRLSQGQEISTDQVLVSIGRSMNSENIGLEAIGVKRGARGEIIVNRKMETNVPGVYAIGDVTGNIMLAHVASRQGIVAVENALGGNTLMDYSAVPSAIFTHPEIASVGLREKQAAEQGIKYRVGRFQFRALGKAHAIGEISGMVKILAEADTDKVLGVHICGPHATDLIHEGVLAIKSGSTAGHLEELIHAHPTLAEAVMEAAEDIHGRSIHIPPRSQK